MRAVVTLALIITAAASARPRPTGRRRDELASAIGEVRFRIWDRR